MSTKLTELRSQVEAKQREAEAMLAKADPTPEELGRADALVAEMDALRGQIDEHNASAKKTADLKGQLAANVAYFREPLRSLPFGGAREPEKKSDDGRIEAGKSEVEKLAGKGGFMSLGHFAHAVIQRGRDGSGNNPAVDQLRKWDEAQPRLAIKAVADYEAMGFKAPQGLYEGSDPDGGVLVPVDFSRNLYMRARDQGQILSYLNVTPVSGNTMSFPALLENSRVNGSRYGGIQSYWIGEADQYPKSTPRFSNRELRLKKLVVMTYVTEELLSDSFVALDSWLNMIVPREINFRINDAVLNGTGGAMPLGVMNSGSKITVTAVSGQGANTWVAKNVLAMWQRIPAAQRSSVIWLYNQDAEAQLLGLFQPTGTTAGTLFFAPNTDPSGNLKLMGRPAIPCEQCQTLGTEGDVIAFATDGYAAISKGGIESDVSMHLRFDYDERAFKWRFRFDGQPYDDTALTPYNGSSTTSSIVTLSSTRT